MKRFIYPTLLLLFFQVSCLEQIPENTLTYGNAFVTENELNATTTTIQFFINVHFSSNPVHFAAGAKVDETRDNEELRQWNPKTVIGTVDMNGDWKGLYDIIYESNLLLENIHKTENLTEDRYKFHTGQAHFALGLAYFALSQRYGDCVITENSSEIIVYGISPMFDVIEEAIKHAKQAFDVLPIYSELSGLNNISIDSKQYASKGNSAALLAQLYAWKGSMIDRYGKDYDVTEKSEKAYREAVNYATLLIDEKVGNYRLCYSPEELCERLSTPQEENPEAIFTLTFDRSRSEYSVTPNVAAMSYVSWPVNDLLLPGNFMSDTDYKLYTQTIEEMYPDPNDSRRQAFFYELGVDHNLGDDYAILYKFRTSIYTPDEFSEAGKYWRTVDADYVYWRLADLILLRAECYAKLNETGLAENDLNTIRKRAGATEYPSEYDAGMDLKKAIFKERERELLGENDERYYDIIRNDYVKEELTGKFPLLTPADIKGGALFMPIPKSAYTDENGMVVNTEIRQKPYWLPYIR